MRPDWVGAGQHDAAPLQHPLSTLLSTAIYGIYDLIVRPATQRSALRQHFDEEVPGMRSPMMLCAAVLLIPCLLVLGGCDVTDPLPEPVDIESPPPHVFCHIDRLRNGPGE